MIFNKVLSLGPSCETAFQIRQIIDQDEAYVFDWVIADAQHVARAIRNDFEEFIRPEGLTLQGVVDADHPYIADSTTGIEFHHDFQNNDNFLDSLKDVQGKYGYLINRMRSLLESDSAVLFIHAKGTREETLLLDDAISARFPQLRYRLLALGIGKPVLDEDEGNLIARAIPGYGTTWQERTPQWIEVLDPILHDSYGTTLVRLPLTNVETA